MPLTRHLVCLLTLLALWGCDDDDSASNADAAADARPVADTGPEDASPPDAQPDMAVVDEEAPTLRFERPLDGELVRGQVDVELIAADDVAVTEVALTIDGVDQTPLTAAPYVFRWDTSGLMDGRYLLVARAKDAAGHQTEASVYAAVQQGCRAGEPCPPRNVRFVTPPEGTALCGEIQVVGTADDPDGLAKLTFFIDDQPLGEATEEPFTVVFDTTTVADGPHVMKLIAEDTTGAAAFGVQDVTVSNAGACNPPPTLSFFRPTEGEIIGLTVPVLVRARDNEGVMRVQFYVDGQLEADDPTDPYGFEWYTQDLTEGAHRLVARAEDRTNQLTSLGVNVVVDHTPPAVALLLDQASPSFEGAITGQVTAEDLNGVVSAKVRLTQLDPAPADGQGVTELPLEAPDFAVELPTDGLPSGIYELQAFATDSAGLEGATEALRITLDRAPEVAITTPRANATVWGPVVQVRATASDDFGVAEVRLYAGDADLGAMVAAEGVYAGEFLVEAEGPVTLRAVATTTTGQTGEGTVQVNARRLPADLTLRLCHGASCQPFESGMDVADAPTLTVGATSLPGAPTLVATTLSDDAELAADDAAPFSLAFDTGAWADGVRILTLGLTFSDGLKVDLPLGVKVNNCDRDNDGVLGCGGPDCDDLEPAMGGDRVDTCDNLDNDCDGALDEDADALCGTPPVVDDAVLTLKPYATAEAPRLNVWVSDPDQDYAVAWLIQPGQLDAPLELGAPAFEAQEGDALHLGFVLDEVSEGAQVVVLDRHGLRSALVPVRHAALKATAAVGARCDDGTWFVRCQGACVDGACVADGDCSAPGEALETAADGPSGEPRTLACAALPFSRHPLGVESGAVAIDAGDQPIALWGRCDGDELACGQGPLFVDAAAVDQVLVGSAGEPYTVTVELLDLQFLEADAAFAADHSGVIIVRGRSASSFDGFPLVAWASLGVLGETPAFPVAWNGADFEAVIPVGALALTPRLVDVRFALFPDSGLIGTTQLETRVIESPIELGEGQPCDDQVSALLCGDGLACFGGRCVALDRPTLLTAEAALDPSGRFFQVDATFEAPRFGHLQAEAFTGAGTFVPTTSLGFVLGDGTVSAVFRVDGTVTPSRLRVVLFAEDGLASGALAVNALARAEARPLVTGDACLVGEVFGQCPADTACLTGLEGLTCAPYYAECPETYEAARLEEHPAASGYQLALDPAVSALAGCGLVGEGAVVSFTAPAAGAWAFFLSEPGEGGFLSVRERCALADSELACASDGEPRVLQLSLLEGETIYLVAIGATLTAELF